MPIPVTASLALGGYFTFWAEHAGRTDLAHTVAEVCLLAVDTRDVAEPWALYLVQQPNGRMPILAACTAYGFTRECSPSRTRPWIDHPGRTQGLAFARQIIEASPAPGIYDFTLELKKTMEV